MGQFLCDLRFDRGRADRIALRGMVPSPAPIIQSGNFCHDVALAAYTSTLCFQLAPRRAISRSLFQAYLYDGTRQHGSLPVFLRPQAPSLLLRKGIVTRMGRDSCLGPRTPRIRPRLPQRLPNEVGPLIAKGLFVPRYPLPLNIPVSPSDGLCRRWRLPELSPPKTGWIETYQV